MNHEEMQEKYGHNWSARPHSEECDCDWCYEWTEDWREYESKGGEMKNITYCGVNQPRRVLRKEEYLSRKECADGMRAVADIVEKGSDTEMVFADIMVSTRDKEDGE